MTQARLHKKEGGVAISFMIPLQCKKMFFGNFASFEVVALQLISFSQATCLMTLLN